MPKIDNLERQPFNKNTRNHFLNVQRGEILYREDLKTGFGYAIVGISIALAVTGTLYVVGKKLLA